jgi:hypothetical protein
VAVTNDFDSTKATMSGRAGVHVTGADVEVEVHLDMPRSEALVRPGNENLESAVPCDLSR